MKQRIYIPSNFAFPEIIGNIDSECKKRDFDLVKTNEKTCNEHTLLNRGALSLLSPLGYGLGVRKADFRIVPTNVAGFVGYSGKSSLYFRQGLATIDKIGVKDTDEYFTKIGKILLSERYDIDAEFEKTNLDLPEILNSFPSAILNGNNINHYSMDICEDWFETFEIPLILGVWVVRNEEEPADVVELTKSFAVDDLPYEIDNGYHDESNLDHLQREGKVLTKWDEDMKNAFEQTLELLFYHHLLPEIPAVKIYGID